MNISICIFQILQQADYWQQSEMCLHIYLLVIVGAAVVVVVPARGGGGGAVL